MKIQELLEKKVEMCSTNEVIETATAGGTSAGGIASTGNGFLNGGPGVLSRNPKKKKTKRKTHK